MKQKTFWIIFAIAAALRIFAINRAPLWYDENFTLLLARLPFDQMIQATAGDVHPPLWYIINWILFHAFIDLPAWVVRLPALTFSLLALYTFHQLLTVIQIPSRVQWIAISLMAILPMQLWYAQEGRMYAMLEFLVLFTLFHGLKRNWVVFTFSATAMLYTQNYGLFYLAVIGVVIVLGFFIMGIYGSTNYWHSCINNSIISGTVAVTLYTPWFFVVSNQMTEIEGRYWIMDAGPGAVLNAVYKQFWVSSMLSPGVITSHVITFALLIIGTYYAIKQKHWIVLSMGLAPFAIAWLVSWLWQPVLLFRPLIGTSPFLYLLVALPFASVPPYLAMGDHHKKVLYTACFTLPLFIFGIGGYYINISNMKGEGATQPLLSTLDYIKAHWQPGDIIYYTDDSPMINLMPYAGDMPQYKLPACDEKTGYAPVLGSLSDSTRQALGIQTANIADIEYQRAWVFAPRSPLHPECYEKQIEHIAPEGKQLITVDDNQFISSGIWLLEK